jgi:hypothetical protein
MPKPTADWKEDDVLSLSSGENDTFERKGSRLLDLTIPNVKEGEVLDELGKQLSAFANTGGGQIVYGLANDGTVDNGGVSRTIKGRQSTKEWLEDIVPTLTDFEIIGFNIFEIPRNPAGSMFAPDKTVYVVDVPDSERTPHQSKRDLKYYIRLGGKSRPAPHRIIEDIRNRARYPRLEVYDIQLSGAAISSRANPPRAVQSEFRLNMNLSFGVRNIGGIRAANACLGLSSGVPLSANVTGEECFLRRGSPGTILIELKNPLYPGMGITTGCMLQADAAVQILANAESLTFGGLSPTELPITVSVFADSSPSRKQEFRLNEIDREFRLNQLVKEEVRNIHHRLQHSGSQPHVGRWS